MSLIDQIKKDEGFCRYAYKCTAGKWTIGYGLNIDPDESGPGISEKFALMILNEHVTEVTRQLWNRIPDVMSQLDPARQDVLVMMAYQMGVAGLMKFKKTLDYLKNKQWDKAGEEMLDSAWAKQTPLRAKRLSNMIVSGEY